MWSIAPPGNEIRYRVISRLLSRRASFASSAGLRRVRGSESMLEPTQIRVEHVARNEPGADPAGDRLKLALTDQRANVVVRAAELDGNLADRQGCGPLHARSMACGGSTRF
jgi:hypothetical protein